MYRLRTPACAACGDAATDETLWVGNRPGPPFCSRCRARIAVAKQQIKDALRGTFDMVIIMTLERNIPPELLATGDWAYGRLAHYLGSSQDRDLLRFRGLGKGRLAAIRAVFRYAPATTVWSPDATPVAPAPYWERDSHCPTCSCSITG